jgi:Prolyl oligopeptidase family
VAACLLLNAQMFAGKARCMSEDAPELTAELVVDGTVPSQPVVAPDGLGIGGASYGGFMAAWAIGQTDRFKAAVMDAGISDWGRRPATGDRRMRNDGCRARRQLRLGGHRPAPARSGQPDLVRVEGPHSGAHRARRDDTNVPVSQAIYFHRALRRFGVEHDLLIYPREGHRFAERNHQIDLLRRTRAWFGRWLRDGASGGRGLIN